MGCWESKNVDSPRRPSLFRSSAVYTTPEFGLGPPPGKLSPEELADVKHIMNTLRTEQLDLVMVSCMYDKLFQVHPSVKQMFINAAFLDPEYALGCTSDPWFQGFLKAYINAIIKYILLQADETKLQEFLGDLKESHLRVAGIEKIHVEMMMQFLYMGFVQTMGSSIDQRKRSALEHLLSLLYHDALQFLPLTSDSRPPAVTDDASSIRAAS
ncbi:unnamed protein product, partial [Candidula unifasciata]